MAKQFPADRFDDIPDDLVRVGAHRAPAPKGRGFVAFAWAALATGLIVGASVIGLSLFSDSINIDLPFSAPQADPLGSPSEEPVVEVAEPVLDPDLAITVLNGTTTTGLANTAADALLAAGWCGAAGTSSPEEGPCAGTGVTGSRANAGADDVEATVVFYPDAANEGAARALVQSLGVGEIRMSSDYPQSPLTVLLGSDYVPPVS